MPDTLVIFDFDGTLADAQALFDQALIEFTAQQGLACDLYKMKTGYIDPLRFDLGFGVPLADQPAILKAYHVFMDSQADRFIPGIFAGVPDLLAALDAAGHDRAIATLRDRRSLLLSLQKHGLDRHFAHWRTSCCAADRGYPPKPAPDMLHCLIRDMDHAGSRVVMVGDTTSDIDMARAAGIPAIGVLWGAHDRARLQSANPALIVEDMADLPAAIEAALAA